MSKINGLGVRVYSHGYDLSGDINAISGIATSQALLTTTNLAVEAESRIAGLADGSISVNAWFEASDFVTPDKLGELQALTTGGALRTTDVAVLVPLGQALGDPCVMLVAKAANHNVNRAPGNAVAATWEWQGKNYGTEWGVMLTAGKRTDASAANGTSIDAGAASNSLGASAQCQVFSVATGTVVPVAQDSADDVSFAAITGLTFTGVATAGAPTAERLETSATLQIRRYRRCASTGTFTNAALAMGINVR